MKTIEDHLGRSLTYNYLPKRIISFAPAITDTLYSLNLEKKIVGRTRFCIHPKGKVEQAVNVGGTKDMKLDRVLALKPDLIIVEKEENTKEMVQQLEAYFPVFVFEVQTVADALKMIDDLGKLTARQQEATNLIKKIKTAFDQLPTLDVSKRAAYMIWKNPYMVVGNNTYIQSLLETLGFANPFIAYEGRYPSVTKQDILQANLDYIFLATEPFPFREKHLQEFKKIAPQAKPLIVDGEMFWYGVKMLKAAHYFRNELLSH
ncbi:helical backbone metal receptor [Pseudogracilibacillus sp. SE30717A]|uniref:ABC transporter substrate-binding protein n=1 Tax=Pseudogracilibacillus sp. SE30717A TaxID=3098293 RepID=UPI00300DCEA6